VSRSSPEGNTSGRWIAAKPRDGGGVRDQTACKPGSVPLPCGNAAVIPLDRPSRAGSRDLPGSLGPATALPSLLRARDPYSVLLLAGLAVRPLLPATRWALTPPFHPYPDPKAKAVCFLWRYPWGRPRRALPAAMSSWSPDFPRARRPATARPSDPVESDGLLAPKGQPANRSSAISLARVSPSATPSKRCGRQWRWKALTTVLVSASNLPEGGRS
jgi:hypothetical protein